MSVHLRTESYLKSLFESMSSKEQSWCLAALDEIQQGRNEVYNSIIQADYKWEPPTIRQFMEDDYYAGVKGKTLYPLIRDEVENIIVSDKSEVILTGAIGWGKSYAASFGLAYDFTWLSCLANAQEYCGIAKGTDIVLMNLSVTGPQAHDGLYKYVKDIIRSMPYFRDKYSKYDYDNRRWTPSLHDEHIYFKCGGSTEFGPIGSNVIGGALDEANFMVGVRKSKRALMAGELDQAKILYDQIARRRKSRFISSEGKVPCRFWLISSVQFPGDFLEKKIESSKDNPHVAVINHNQWEPRLSDPLQRSRYSGKKFLVFVGNAVNRSHIVTEDSTKVDKTTIDVPNGCYLDEVPIEYYQEFIGGDIQGSIRDILGRPTLSINPLFNDPSIIKECYCDTDLNDVPRIHPFKNLQSTVINPDIINYNRIPIIYTKVRNSDGTFSDSLKPKPALNSHAVRYVHVDLSKNRDATGLAIGHCSGFKDIETIVQVPDPTKESLVNYVSVIEKRPIIVMDVMMKFTAPLGGCIDMQGIRSVILSLQKICGYTYKLITYDQYQSAESIMAFNQRGILSEVFSVDRNEEPYLFLRGAIEQKRFSMYPYEPFIEDCGSLEHNISKCTVDHTPGKGKDVSDCVAAVVAHIEKFHPRQVIPLIPEPGLMSSSASLSVSKDKSKFNNTLLDLESQEFSVHKSTKSRLDQMNKQDPDFNESNIWDLWGDEE